MIHSARYVNYSWLCDAKSQKDPDESQAQIHWLKRLLLESKPQLKEWIEMGRALPDTSSVPERHEAQILREKGIAHTGNTNYVWLDPKFLAKNPKQIY